MRCKNCGTENTKESKFCEKCGVPIIKKSKAPIYIILTAIMLAIFVVVGIFTIFPGNAYEKQLNIGYELLNEGKYEEAVLAFDKAIKIDEKQPEAYMYKAESMAYNPDMTEELAEEIIKVLETGYEKSGDKKILEHADNIADILKDNGFADFAGIVLNSEENEKTDNSINFNKFSKYFGMEKDTVLKDFSNSVYAGDWIGSEWFDVEDGKTLAFDYSGKCSAMSIPLVEIYPRFKNSEAVISKEKFDEYLNVNSELVPVEDFSEFSQPFLSYNYENLEVIVYCDEDGYVDVHSTTCQFMPER